MTDLTITGPNRVTASDSDAANVAEIRKEIARVLGFAELEDADIQRTFAQGVDRVRALVHDGRLDSGDGDELITMFAILYASATVNRFSECIFKYWPIPRPVFPFSLDWLVRAPK